MEEMLAKLGLKSAHLITGLLGGAVGLIFGKQKNTLKGRLRSVGVVVIGAVVTGYVTPLILQWKPGWENTEYSIAFLVGIFGMGIIEGFMNLVTSFKKNPISTIKQIKKRE